MTPQLSVVREQRLVSLSNELKKYTSTSTYPRSWKINTNKGVNGEQQQKISFQIMQFNVLADGLAGLRPDKGKFTQIPTSCLDWKFRKLRLLQAILETDVDLICLEEIDHYHDWFLPELSALGYNGVFCAKPRSLCYQVSSNPDGCAIFYRTQMFEEVNDAKVLHYHRKNQLAIGWELRSRSVPSLRLVAVVTHLKAEKSSAGESVRAQEVEELLSWLKLSFGETLPIVMGCDLNATPPTQSQLYPSQAYKLFQPQIWKSAYCEVVGGQEPAYTTWKIRPGKESKHAIDYIFYTKRDFDVLRVLSIPEDDEVDYCRFPSFRYASDHVALVAELAFRTDET